jgi:ectoine hydroxylase-related dioxygenase (phytanoyl-CoA dioxygenase family)
MDETMAKSCDVHALQQDIDTQGYAVLRNVVSRQPLTEFAGIVAETFESAPKFKGGGMITGHLNCFPGRRARFAWDELNASGVVDAVHTIRAGRPNRLRVTMNFNMPGSVAQHYHMDGAYLDDFLICNVAVVDTTLTNGAIDLLPGTNRTFMPFWKYALSRQYKKTTRIEMQAGDVLLRRSNLWHRGMPNHSKVARPLLSFTFGEKSAPEGDPFEVNNGDFAFYTNWYNTSRAGRLREHTFKVFPLSYSAYRFAGSLRNGKRGYASWD